MEEPPERYRKPAEVTKYCRPTATDTLAPIPNQVGQIEAYRSGLQVIVQVSTNSDTVYKIHVSGPPNVSKCLVGSAERGVP